MSVTTKPAQQSNIKIYTLIFVINKNKLLLGMKKRGFGVGKWNGFGGKVNMNESIEQGAVREFEEECGVSITRKDLIDLGYVTYEDTRTIRLVHIFTILKDIRGCCESDEMIPKWFRLEEIPYDKMWPDSKYWLPLVLSGTKLRAAFIYGSNDEIIYKRVEDIRD